ncbi:MlaD family protein [Aquamicrobium segne]|uniref:MlaD family protein n=1 Tax=Aquamicrobium segne TaxID=469547 RepID=A0ABW0H3C8_9HYPH
METRANYVIVGIFTLVAILAAFGFVYWTAAFGDRGETVMVRVRIPGSASGLGRGSFVLFNGVKVGDVRRVYIDVNNPSVAIADAELDRSTPITRSTQADIGLAGLTGQANIELKGANLNEPKLLDEAEKNGTIAEITANPSAVTNLLQTAQDIFGRADKVMSELEGFATDVRGPLTQTVQNAQKFSEALAGNADSVEKFLNSVAALSEELQGVSGKLDGMIKTAEGVLDSVDQERVRQIVTNVDDFTKNLNGSREKFDDILLKIDNLLGSDQADGMMADARETLKAFRQIADTLNARLGTITANLERFSGKGLQGVEALVNDSRRSINRIEQAISDLQRNPQRILSGGDGEVRQYDGRARR